MGIHTHYQNRYNLRAKRQGRDQIDDPCRTLEVVLLFLADEEAQQPLGQEQDAEAEVGGLQDIGRDVARGSALPGLQDDPGEHRDEHDVVEEAVPAVELLEDVDPAIFWIFGNSTSIICYGRISLHLSLS
mgnify:CR=1 FL=1